LTSPKEGAETRYKKDAPLRIEKCRSAKGGQKKGEDSYDGLEARKSNSGVNGERLFYQAEVKTPVPAKPAADTKRPDQKERNSS